jgi:type II secretory pathway pseudopilin PulG
MGNNDNHLIGAAEDKTGQKRGKIKALMVSLAVLGLLAGIFMASALLYIRLPQDKGKRMLGMAKSDLAQLNGAIEMYKQTYGRYPVIGAARDGAYEVNGEVTAILTGDSNILDSTGRSLNPKGYVLLNVHPKGISKRRIDKDGYFDPWGHLYRFSTSNCFGIMNGMLTWSKGSDGQDDTRIAKKLGVNNDNVYWP